MTRAGVSRTGGHHGERGRAAYPRVFPILRPRAERRHLQQTVGLHQSSERSSCTGRGVTEVAWPTHRGSVTLRRAACVAACFTGPAVDPGAWRTGRHGLGTGATRHFLLYTQYYGNSAREKKWREKKNEKKRKKRKKRKKHLWRRVLARRLVKRRRVLVRRLAKRPCLESY